MTIFILLQFSLFLFMLLHDWLPAPPYNDVATLEQIDKNKSRLIMVIINSTPVLISLVYTLKYQDVSPFPVSVAFNIFVFYACLMFGAIASWWIPYFFGSSAKHKEKFSKFKNTHHFLPVRGDNVVPNTLHVMLHVLVLFCLLFSIYYSFILK